MIFAEQEQFRVAYLILMSQGLMTIEKISELIKRIESLVFAMEIIENKPKGGLDKAITMTIMTNTLHNTSQL